MHICQWKLHPSDEYAGEAAAIIDGTRADAFRRIGNVYGCEAGAARESRCAEVGQRIWEIKRNDAVASHKSAISDVSHPIRDGYGSEAGAIAECGIADAGHGIGGTAIHNCIRNSQRTRKVGVFSHLDGISRSDGVIQCLSRWRNGTEIVSPRR